MNSMIKSTLFIILCLAYAASSSKLNLKQSNGDAVGILLLKKSIYYSV